MDTLLLIPVDDSVVFPEHDCHAGHRRRRRGARAARAPQGRRVRQRRHGGRGHRAHAAARRRPRSRARPACTAPRSARPAPAPTAPCASRSSRSPDAEPVDGRTRELEREYRAVVEEILELRGDGGRVAAFVRSITEPGVLADTSGYSPDLTYEQKVELLETLDVTERLEKAARDAARAADRAAGARPHPRRRAVGRREAAARVLPAQADGLDPQGARRRRRLRGRRVPHEDRRSRHAGRRARAGRARAVAARAPWARPRASRA